MSKEIRVAIIGVGNCASALVQGLYHYGGYTGRFESSLEEVSGIMHAKLGGYRIADIRVVAAFDVSRLKVGTDLAEAIYAPPNNTQRFAEVPAAGVIVKRGPLGDGLGKYLKDVIPIAEGPAVDVARTLRDAEVDVVLNYLPVGSERAVHFYAQEVLEAQCALINCMPVFLASDESQYWPGRFAVAGVPIIGDDIKSQVGATIVHRVLTRLFEDRGIRLDRTYQLNFGGNADFLNMLERERLQSKKISKTEAVMSQLNGTLPADQIHIGPSDYVPWLEDRKWCHIRMEGRGFGDTSVNLELKLEVWDSPNSAGVVIDAIRCAKLALDRGLSGPIVEPSAYFMKRPPQQFTDDEARQLVERFIREC